MPLESLDGGYVDEDDETFLGLDEDKDDAKVKRCIQRCGRRYTRDSRSYYNCSNQCRNGMGSSYCTWEPDTSCYKSGWPRCCSRDNGINCPATRPACDKKKVGRDYCTWAADKSCYRHEGWPACCSVNNGQDCPKQQPPCDKGEKQLGRDYCTWAPNKSCYHNRAGLPSCCLRNDGADCPRKRPPCDIRKDADIVSA